MSFFDPFLDAFSSIGDSVSDFAESDAGKLALIAGAAYLTGGASLGGEAGVGASMGSWDVLPALGEGVTAITPETIAASGAMLPAAGAAGLASIPPSPTNLSLLTNTGYAQATAPEIGASNVTNLVNNAGPVSEGTQVADLAPKGSVTFNAAGQPTYTSGTLPTGAPPVAPPPITGAPPVDYSAGANYNLAPQANPVTSGGAPGIKAAGLPPAQGGFADGIDAFSRFVDPNPKTALAATYLGAKGLGLLDPKEAPAQEKYNGVLTRYKMSPDFQASNAQPNVYKPTYAAAGGIMQAGGPVEQMSMNAIGGNTGYPQAGLPHSMGYASPTASPIPQNVVQGDAGDVGVNPQTGQERFAQGGIAHFRKGNLAESMDFYKSMTESQARAPAGPAVDHGPGIYYDQDPDTRYQDALTAAQIRQAKVNKRANVSPPVAKRPTPMGQLNLRPPGAQAAAAGSTLDPENAAQGGIMHSSLGGYAAGGNPRLLKGPGDGMSDNIPATIAGKQPARLADGEFVIPADVVSHLGNGSTDAGAKRLHEMMNKIRKARTGNSKQGKQINPNKYMPA